jgi:hypothetical protein
MLFLIRHAAMVFVGFLGLMPVLTLAQGCPPAGAKFVIKGSASSFNVTSSGQSDPKRGCKFLTEWNGDLWWAMGPDVVPVTASRGAVATPVVEGGSGTRPAAGSVFRCTLPGIGLFTGAYFGIVNDSTYRNFDGKTGNYIFDPRSGVLRMTSGPSKGMAYQQDSAVNFRLLDDQGKRTGGNCVLNTSLRIDGRW